jgi:hypothetical protein
MSEYERRAAGVLLQWFVKPIKNTTFSYNDSLIVLLMIKTSLAALHCDKNVFCCL